MNGIELEVMSCENGEVLGEQVKEISDREFKQNNSYTHYSHIHTSLIFFFLRKTKAALEGPYSS
jgi:hypothetical protein